MSSTIRLTTATGLALLAVAAPAPAATGAACDARVDARYDDRMSGDPGTGTVTGTGSLQCAGALAGGLPLAERGTISIVRPAAWSGTCTTGELSLPVVARHRTLFGTAEIRALLSVQRVGAAWKVAGTGSVVRTGFISGSTRERVRISGGGPAAPAEPCAAEAALLALTVETEPPAAEPATVAACATVARGTDGADHLRGTAGGDLLDGRGGSDLAEGLGGEDCLTGGGGRDRLRGGPGDDQVDAADGTRDRIRCGAGADAVLADPRDRLSGCERVRRSHD